MKISNKLLIIVILTIVEISITLWSVFELSKGAKFHQLNTLHLKYSAVFTRQVLAYEDGLVTNESDALLEMRSTLAEIRKPPVECVELINPLNVWIMKAINTYQAYELCIKDIDDIDNAIQTMDDYQAGKLNKSIFISSLKDSALIFNENSADFEQPITDTVSFLLKVFIPMVVGISLFNIIFISLMSRSISGSIARAIAVLKNKSTDSFQNVATGELKELLDQAFIRAKELLLQEQVNQELENKVTERTASLLKANSELSQFAYRTSHDLKSPVVATRQLTEIIKYDLQNNNIDAALDDIDKVASEMHRLEKLIKGILALTEASQNDSAEIVDMCQLLDDICRTLDVRAKDKNVDIIENIQCPLLVKSSEARLTQIISNLISNAIKYSAPNKSERFVNISIAHHIDKLKIDISDNGLGFPKDRQNEVFEMFKRFHHDVSSGTGLGLAIVKKHVDAMQGTITLNTSEDGSQMLVYLPCQNVTNIHTE